MIMLHPWENVEALGSSTGKTLLDKQTSYYLVIGHKTKYQKDNDTVELEYMNIPKEAKLSVVVLSDEAWTPVWTKNAGRNQVTGNVEKPLLIRQERSDTYHNVLLMINGISSNVWMTEIELSRFIWD